MTSYWPRSLWLSILQPTDYEFVLVLRRHCCANDGHQILSVCPSFSIPHTDGYTYIVHPLSLSSPPLFPMNTLLFFFVVPLLCCSFWPTTHMIERTFLCYLPRWMRSQQVGVVVALVKSRRREPERVTAKRSGTTSSQGPAIQHTHSTQSNKIFKQECVSSSGIAVYERSKSRPTPSGGWCDAEFVVVSLSLLDVFLSRPSAKETRHEI